jgi:hypothetical protein
MDLSQCPPPNRFVAAVDVKRARLLTGQPPFIRRRRSTGRFAVGVKYERQVLEHLSLLVLGCPSVKLTPGPWIEFTDKTGRRWCQPDAILTDTKQGFSIIYEIKYQHTSDAWWQLRWLYEPVLSIILPGVIGLVEICHWHDPATAFPEQYDLTKNPLVIPNAKRLAVHIWDPKRRHSR